MHGLGHDNSGPQSGFVSWSEECPALAGPPIAEGAYSCAFTYRTFCNVPIDSR